MYEIEMVKLLILHGAYVNEKCTLGKTPLHEAITKNREIVEVLISHGSNVNAKDNNGDTPLYLAAQLSNKEIFDLLISYGAEMSLYDKMNFLFMRLLNLISLLYTFLCRWLR
ncbi:hypothetical protein TVAG_295290 [Trichomonas vaginalis G3]|uniref:Uncharacterized protein n=1 Tax=Trichomonas vaginalis (strain ATCC PRA-98 / G3) TaxID=412133 RepID=A2DL86_TRIV3|nr:proteasome regulatory particle assembly [Trichomonas vaginalis G3]EAY18877.1 hypothetical protein TVAG_295290 [Trichomonas vaginalis G3]KAI5526004.1 proteasome regulatory particle assembly [Trichomonas vaginalis G3]|eukprot:XP_001579863.1 hypothetical protein [Trichomonas vaginalis G3]